MKVTLGLAAIATALALTVAACGGSGGATPSAPASATAETPFQKTALWVEQDGQTRPFENGSAVSVGALNMEIFMAPYPPLREGSIDLYLTDKTTGKPAEATGLQMTFDMYMPHGVLRTEALPTGGGHFLVPYKLVMPGEWRADLTATLGADRAAMGFIFQVK